MLSFKAGYGVKRRICGYEVIFFLWLGLLIFIGVMVSLISPEGQKINLLLGENYVKVKKGGLR